MVVTKLIKIFCFRVRTRKTFNMLYNNLCGFGRVIKFSILKKQRYFTMRRVLFRVAADF